MTFTERSQACMTCKQPKMLRGERDGPVQGMALTRRERQISALIADGKSNKEIGEALHITEGTVKTFCNPLFIKAGVHNRTALAVWWLRKSDNSHISE